MHRIPGEIPHWWYPVSQPSDERGPSGLFGRRHGGQKDEAHHPQGGDYTVVKCCET